MLEGHVMAKFFLLWLYNLLLEPIVNGSAICQSHYILLLVIFGASDHYQ